MVETYVCYGIARVWFLGEEAVSTPVIWGTGVCWSGTVEGTKASEEAYRNVTNVPRSLHTAALFVCCGQRSLRREPAAGIWRHTAEEGEKDLEKADRSHTSLARAPGPKTSHETDTCIYIYMEELSRSLVQAMWSA